MEAGRITVVGTVSDRTLVETAATLRALAAALPRLVPGAFDHVPTIVVAVAREPGHLARVGLAAGRTDAGPIVLVSTGEEEARPDLLRAAAAALAEGAGSPPPRWLVTGLSEYLSTFTATAARATLGRPIVEHVTRLRSARVGTGRPALFSDAPVADGASGALRRSEAWAVVHLLLNGTADGPERLGRFVQRLAEGRDGEAAFREAFGEDERALLDRAVARAIGSRPLARYLDVPSSSPPPGRVFPLTRAGAAGLFGTSSAARRAPAAIAAAAAAAPPSTSAASLPPARPSVVVSRAVPAEVDLVNRLIDEGREEEALARLESLHASLGADPEMQRALGWDVAEVRRVVVHNRLVRRYNEAIALLNAGRRDEALPIFREVAANAEDPELRRLATERATVPEAGRR